MVDKKLLTRNSLSGFIQKIIIAVVTFLAIPIFIRTKGTQVYGIFATIGVLGELGRLTELGFNKTLVKFLSVQGKTRESSQDIIVASSVVLSLLIPLTVFLFLADNFILTLVLKIPKADLSQSRQFYYYAVSANFFLLLGSLYSSVIESQRLIYKINQLQLIYSLLYWGLIILAILLGFGLREIGMAIFISAFIWFILIVGMLKYTWGHFDLTGFRGYLKVSLKKLTNYSLKIYVSSLLGFFEEPLIKILVSHFFGIKYVGFLDVGIRVKSQLYRLLQTLVYPLFQLFSELTDKKNISFIMKDIEEKLFLLITPLCIVLATCSGSFIHLWLGSSESSIILSVIFISVGALLLQLTILPTLYYLTIYHPVILLFTQIVGIVVSILIVYVGHFFIGYSSVYLSFVGSYLVDLFMRLYYQKKFLNCTLFSDKGYLTRFVGGMILLTITGFTLSYLFRFNHFVKLMVTPISLFILTLLLMKYLRLITHHDFERYPILQTTRTWYFKFRNQYFSSKHNQI
jgi:O-antigen/teichoic acid export membrane protein